MKSISMIVDGLASERPRLKLTTLAGSTNMIRQQNIPTSWEPIKWLVDEYTFDPASGLFTLQENELTGNDDGQLRRVVHYLNRGRFSIDDFVDFLKRTVALVPVATDES